MNYQTLLQDPKNEQFKQAAKKVQALKALTQGKSASPSPKRRQGPAAVGVPQPVWQAKRPWNDSTKLPPISKTAPKKAAFKIRTLTSIYKSWKR